MRAIGFRLLVELRTRWRSLLFLTLVVAVAGGSMLLGVLGARRTASTVSRLQHESRASEVSVTPTNDDVDLARWRVVERLPQVERVSTLIGAVVAPVVDGQLDYGWFGIVAVVAGTDRYLFDQDRPKVLSGRLYDPHVRDEAVVNETAARRLGLRAGASYDVRWFDAKGAFPPAPTDGVPETITVTGIVRSVDDALRDPDDPNLVPTMVLSPASAHPELAFPYLGTSVRLRRGTADVSAFVAAAHQALPDVPFLAQEASAAAARKNHSLRPYVLALLGFAVTAGGVGLALAMQAVARQERADAEGRATLWALGATRRQLVVLGAARAGVVGVLGALAALGLSITLSPLTPLRSARLLEPDPGVRFDPIVLLLALGVVLGLVAAGALAAAATVARFESRSRRVGPVRPPRLVHLAPGAATVAGLNFAFDRGRGVRRTSLYSSLAGIALGTAVAVAAVVYGASLGRFATTPARFGWTWDMEIGENGIESEQAIAAFDRMRADPAVDSLVYGNYGSFAVGGHSVPVIGVGDGTAPVGLTMLSGREATSDHEVVLGEQTLDDLGVHVGDHVDLSEPVGVRLTVVGTAVFAPFAPYQLSEPTELGAGAAMTYAALPVIGQGTGAGGVYGLVRFRPGQSLTSEQIVDRYFDGDAFAVEILGIQRPTTVRGFRELRMAPYVFAGVVAVIVLATMAHYLLTSAQRRRRDLAVLQALGLAPSHLRRVLGVQAAVVTVLALVVAIPIGLVIGRVLWQVTARWLDVADDVLYPALAVAGVAIATLAAASVLSLVAAARAARQTPAAAFAGE